jgi:hypothetical protein
MSDEVNAKIKKFVEESGFKEGVVRTCTHRSGMPGTRVMCVLPEWSPVDGSHTLVVTATEVISMTCLIPWGYNKWETRAQWPYTSPKELKEILDREVKKPAGCWA